jgi:predicted acyl esterase
MRPRTVKETVRDLTRAAPHRNSPKPSKPDHPTPEHCADHGATWVIQSTWPLESRQTLLFLLPMEHECAGRRAPAEAGLKFSRGCCVGVSHISRQTNPQSHTRYTSAV